MTEAQTCPIEDHSDAQWAIPLPEATYLSAPALWAAILDPETKTKGRMIAVLSGGHSLNGMLGNNCPQEVRDKIAKMVG